MTSNPSPPSTLTPRVEISTAVFADNIHAVQAALSASTRLICVVKSDAYGHGIPPMVHAALQAGADHFAVAYLEEALAVRAAAPDAKMILLIGVAQPEDVPLLLAHNITPLAICREQAQALATAAHSLGRNLPVHLKIDSGMGRLGFVCPAELDCVLDVCRFPGLDVRGICTHFATVEPSRYPQAAPQQIERFQQAVAAVETTLQRRLFRHASSSRAAMLLPDCDLDGVRMGIALYGYGAKDSGLRFQTRPVLQWKARVLQVKTVPARFPVGYYGIQNPTPRATDIATLGVGYADGYPRHLSNKGIILIGGRRCKVIGRVSMNWITVDLGPSSGIQAGAEAVLLGTQGDESIWADELAALYQTISYEILTGISARLCRSYI